MAKFNPILASTYEFVDVENGCKKTVKAGKTLTSESGSATLSSSFRIDGVNCWEYLHRLGYEVHQEFLPGGKSILRFDVYRLGKLAATHHLADAKDPWNDSGRSLLYLSQASYRIEIVDARLEDIVFVAFILSRVNIVE